MPISDLFHRAVLLRAIAKAACLLFLASAGINAASARPHDGPCDILQRAGTPCVAAHSTVRALFAA